MDTKPEKSNGDDAVKDLKSEIARLQSIINGSMTPMVMIDRDFNITEANDATVALLESRLNVLQSVFPGFDPSKMVGSNIDSFHKNPTHQRQLLSNPKNLPIKTDISVGPLTFELNVSGLFDENDEYIGNSLEWSDVTEVRKHEDEAIRLRAAVGESMSAVMMVDLDLIVTYANQATIDLLTKNEADLKAVYPFFDVSKLIGSCIDVFHKDPSHQRKLLADPNNLPFKTDISVGPLKFELNVSAQRDRDGSYIGSTLEWQDVTETRVKELEVARLQSAVTGASSSLMLCDHDLNITYVNPAVIDLFRNRVNELRSIWPTLDPDHLIGQNIDQFHKNPAHQRALLSNINALPAKAEIKILDIVFEVNATAIVGPSGEYMGNMVEWKDITEQKDAENQINELIVSASAGELDRRIDATNYAGFMRGLSEGINTLIDAFVVPLREGSDVIQALSGGDLTKAMSDHFNGEFGVFKNAINESITNLSEMVSNIREAAGSIGDSASEISQGNADLSQRTEEQASSLEETASSMEELTGTVKQNAENSIEANNLASGARLQAEKGGEVVSKAVSAMSEINSSSKKIADIIGVIDEIAFQTNLLALNAAVEAARAGEQGRGFAVVASEVRNLAQRSASAAKEIKALISDSVEKVDEGSKLVNESGEMLGEIVTSVIKVGDIIAEIATASQEQASGIDQVNMAINSMDEVTQQNAALVEEAAAASEAMDEQARGLIDSMGFFTTK